MALLMQPRRSSIELNLTNIIILVIMTMILVQGVGIIFNSPTIKLGPVFILIAIGMSAALSIAIFKKLINDQEVTKKDLFAMLVTFGITLALMFFLRDFVPEIFVQGISQIQGFLTI